MAGTTAAALKSALKTAMEAEGSLSGVLISYGDPGEIGRVEHIWLGAATDGDSINPTFRAGRKRREETYELDIVVYVASKPRPEDNEARAVVLGTVIEEMIADDPKISATTNLLWVRVLSFNLDSVEGPEGPKTEYTITVEAKGRLL